MAVQFDKELLIKHHFWILLGSSILLALIALIMLPSSVGQTVEKEEKTFNSNKEALTKLNQPKNEKWVKAFEVQDGVVKGKKDEVWGDSWKVQETMMTWPDSLEDKWSPRYQYFGDEIDVFDRQEFPA